MPGENNAGKSHLTRAIDMVFGERCPGTLTLDDDDFRGRYPCRGQVTHIRRIYDPQSPQ